MSIYDHAYGHEAIQKIAPDHGVTTEQARQIVLAWLREMDQTYIGDMYVEQSIPSLINELT